MSRVTVTVRLEKDLYEAFRVLAWVSDRRINDVMVEALTAYAVAQPMEEVMARAQEAHERFQATLDRLRDD